MRNPRRIATVGLSVVAVGALFAGTAGAQTAGSYAGQASAEALTINLFGIDLTTSKATAELTSAPLAKAMATQILTPAIAPPKPATAQAVTVGANEASDEADCTGGLPDLSEIPALARADITCGTATAALTQGGGDARGLGAQVVLEPSVSGLLGAIQLQEPAQQVAGTIREALNPLVEALTDTPIDEALTTVEEVLDQTLSLESTARISIAPALAQVTAKDCVLTSVAHAQAIRVELLPVAKDITTDGLLPADLTAGEPLLTITLANAEVTKRIPICGNGGEEVVEHKPALLTVETGSTELLETLGLASQKIDVAPGQSLCVLEGTPLETCLAAASSGVDANGNPFADSGSIELFKGVNNGITLVTGRASSGGGAAPAPAAPAVAVPAGELPRTGGSATLPIVGGALLALAAATGRLAFGRR